MIALIRPLPALDASVDHWRRQGLECAGIAVQNIVPQQDVATKVQAILLERQDAQAIIIVTSQYACSALIEAVAQGFRIPKTWRIVAIGPKTLTALSKLKEPVQVPQQHDSEGVLALADLQNVAGRPVIILKGEQGRDTLATTLAAKGANVVECKVYRRALLTLSERDWQQLKNADTIVSTNGEALHALMNAPKAQSLRSKKWVVPSKRIAEQAQQFGISSIQISAGASDSALIQCIHQFME